MAASSSVKDTTKRLTSGSPMSLILGFSLPLLVGMLFQQFYSLVDTIIVGKFLGVNALAAVGSTGSVNFLINGFCMGVCTGFAIPVAQRFGAEDEEGLRRYVGNSIWLSAVFAVIMTVIVSVFCREILILMQTPADIIDDAYAYIFIIFVGIPVTYLYNLTSGIIRSLGDSRTPVYFLLMASALNIVLDILFITQFDSGVAGAAYATVISQLVSGIALPDLHGEKISDPAPGAGRLKAPETVHDDTLLHGRSHGPAVFHYRHRLCDPAGCRQRTGFRGRSLHDCCQPPVHVRGLSL